MLPESGTVMLTIMRIVVVLPAPFGPMRPKTRPGRTCRLRSLTAVNTPKRLVTRSRTSVGFVSSISVLVTFAMCLRFQIPRQNGPRRDGDHAVARDHGCED